MRTTGRNGDGRRGDKFCAPLDTEKQLATEINIPNLGTDLTHRNSVAQSPRRSYFPSANAACAAANRATGTRKGLQLT
jgi:hypothetical protein